MDYVSHLDIPDDAKAMLIVAGVETMFKAKPQWSPEDVAILREHFTKAGAAHCATLLPHKTIGAIHGKARSLRLALPPQKKQTAKYFSTPHIDEAIRRYYQNNPKRGGLSKLAHQIARPVKWVSVRAAYLAVQAPRFDSVKWDDREIELLREHAFRVPAAIARILRKNGFRRSPNAINLKRTRLHCDRSTDDYYTAIGLAELMGVDKSTITTWVRRGLLKAQKRGTTHPNDSYLIHHNAVRRFVVENANAVDLRRVDKYWFIELMAGTGS